MLDLAQLLRVPHIDNSLRFDLSPNGDEVAFSWNGSGNWEIYEMSLRRSNLQHNGEFASSQCMLTTMISRGAGSKFAPGYSPDGKYLAYALDLDGSESYHIVVNNLEKGSVQDLTPQSGYAHQPNIAWSPDGIRIAVLSEERGQFALYTISSSGGEAKLLMDIHRPCWDVRWSSNGMWFCVEAETTASDRGLFIVSVEGGEPIQICENGNLLNAQHAAWSPDSKIIAFSGENGEWHDIGLYEVESGKVMWMNQSEGDDTSPCWSVDGSRLGWVHVEGATNRIDINESSGEIRQYQVGTGIHHHPQFTRDGKSLIFLFESPSQPADLWKLDLNDGSFEQLTNSLPTELRNTEFIQPEEVWYPSDDGVMVPALLYCAKESKHAVVNIHGGPNWHLQFLWHPIMSYMASRGWAVLAPNYRGSTGYGKKWQNASRYDMGGVDTRDCAAGVKYLVNNSLADNNKIAVTGRSHGGYLTMTCMTMFPDLWSCGSAVVPFLNWLDSHYKSRQDLQHWNIENMGDPDENKELWIERSPYFILDKIKAPVQMICGENDPRCPASESISARDKLVELGREVELILYKGEGHSFLKVENVIDSEIRQMEFLAKVLK